MIEHEYPPVTYPVVLPKSVITQRPCYDIGGQEMILSNYHVFATLEENQSRHAYGTVFIWDPPVSSRGTH